MADSPCSSGSASRKRTQKNLSSESIQKFLEEFIDDSGSDIDVDDDECSNYSDELSELLPESDEGLSLLQTGSCEDPLDTSVSEGVAERGRPRIRISSTSRVRRTRGRSFRSSGASGRGKKMSDQELGWTDSDIRLDEPQVFNGFPGVKGNFATDATPFDVFCKFFDESILNKIKCETNTYARQQIVKAERKGPLAPKSLLGRWKSITVSEIRVFFAIIIHMSLVQKPKISDYWSSKPILQTTYCSSIGMSRDRFKDIFSLLHLNDNDNYIPREQDGHDPLYKVRPLVDLLLGKFRTLYYPNENLTIDEGMCPFRGRVRFRVYIKNKPHKYGIKLFQLCEASSGYVFNFEVYTGASKDKAEKTTDGPVIEMIERLIQPLNSDGHTLYMDRYFTSPKLFDKLTDQKLKAVGTVMPNRKELPREAFQTKLKKGDMVFRRRNHLLAIKWYDTRDVYMLSTVHKATMEDCVQRGSHEKVKPSAILSYNNFKVGVDRSDQCLAYYAFKRRTIKWWKKLFMHLFDLAVVNSWIVFRKVVGKKIRLEDFFENLAQGFIDQAAVESLPQDPTSSAGRLLGRNHFPEKAEETAKGGRGRRTCKVCSERGKAQTGKCARKDTQIICSMCRVPLCLFECFADYHTYVDYVNREA